MSRNMRVLQMEKTAESSLAAAVGRVVRVEADGNVFVDFPGSALGPIRARLATREPLEAGTAQRVLLVFEDGSPDLPIVMGTLRDSLRQLKPQRVQELDAAEEITITCGKSSITLRRDGRIVIKGTELVSRASRTNKIRGAAVEIN